MKQPRIALITDPAHPGLRPDDLCLTEAFQGVGIRAEAVPWGSLVDGKVFTAAVIRTPWDYFERHAEFLAWVDALGVPLINPASVVRWNSHKGYLVELQERGLARLPRTVLLGPGDRPAHSAPLLELVGSDRAVLKPAVSGGAYRTFVLTGDAPIPWDGGTGPQDGGTGPQDGGTGPQDGDAGDDFLVQAFVDGILGDGPGRGEWSLVFFGGQFSHSLRKVASAGDFRVQEEHGGRVLAETCSPELVDSARHILEGTVRHLGLGRPLAYARVDLVVAEGEPFLMELELIEPELFFRTDAASPGCFARAVLDAL